jgi:sulfite reductase alpha subunit-like flavoprotein
MTAAGNNPPSPSNGDRVEEILVLYGSQTGNSEAAAHEICSLLPTKLSPPDSGAATSSTSNTPRRVITSRVMHLDDFLEIEMARWTRLVIIVTSSYGVGQAPIGARKFRDVCDEILNRYDGASDEATKVGGGDNADGTPRIKNNPRFLEEINFALLGLGDSHYTTFFKNPTTIHRALTLAGATLVGEIGKADASGTGNMEQSKVIDRWIENIWGELAKTFADVDATTVTSNSNAVHEADFLDKARNETWEICLELFPEWRKKTAMANYASMMVGLYIPLLGILVAILAHHLFLNA